MLGVGEGGWEQTEQNGCSRKGAGVQNVGGMGTGVPAEWCLKILCLAKLKG